MLLETSQQGSSFGMNRGTSQGMLIVQSGLGRRFMVTMMEGDHSGRCMSRCMTKMEGP